MKKLIHIDNEPYTRRRHHLFFHDQLIEAGVEVEVWSLSKFYFGDLQLADPLEVPYLKKVATLDEFEKLLSEVDVGNTVFVLEYWNLWRSRKIFRLLSENGCYFIRFHTYANTAVAPEHGRSRWVKWQRLLSPDAKERILRRLHDMGFRWYCRIHNVRSYNRFYSSSVNAPRTHCNNQPDYEEFMWGDHTPVVEGSYIVFLDQYFPYHPDLKRQYPEHLLLGGEAYQKTMSTYFDYLEKKNSMPVVIAAHPKAEYNNGEFGGRRIIKYCTNALVYNASAVLCHFSCAVSYLTLQEKPMVFLSTDGMDAIPKINENIRGVASFMGKKVYNLDHTPFDEIDISPIDKETRDTYKYSFLTSKETEYRRNVDIMIDLLTDDFANN